MSKIGGGWREEVVGNERRRQDGGGNCGKLNTGGNKRNPKENDCDRGKEKKKEKVE